MLVAGAVRLVFALLHRCSQQGELDRLATAKVLKGGVAPREWPLVTRIKPSAEDLRFGDTQMKRMVHDRGELALSVRPGSMAWQWCAHQFAGEGSGARIYWSLDEPDPGHPSDHAPATEDSPACLHFTARIQVQGAGQKDSEAGWSAAVFELNSIANDPDYTSLIERAMTGAISRSDFVDQYMRLHYLASVKTHLVYDHLWPRAPAQTRGSEDKWRLKTPPDYAAWPQACPDAAGYARRVAVEYYDTVISRCLANIGRLPHASPAPWPLNEPFPPTAADLKHGELQVERMVRNRPCHVASGVRRDSPVWRWCVRHFAGASSGKRIYWDGATPVDSLAEHRPAIGRRNAVIRVSGAADCGDIKDVSAGCSALWGRVVFELNNVDEDPGCAALRLRAFHGKITREQFVRGFAYHEYLAARKTAAIFLHVYRTADGPYLTGYYSWFLGAPQSFDVLFLEFRDRSAYPWNPYSAYYDQESWHLRQ